MHTIDRLTEALQAAGQLGYRIRQEWLDGRGGGGCEIAGQKWIFLDLAQSASEQLEVVLTTLRDDPNAQALIAPLADVKTPRAA